MKELECLRCSHKWFPRSNNTPILCPSCKSKYWNEVRKKKDESNKLRKGKIPI
jgi:DNA-directed RNA polymerase subunit RPC12/RpoP